MSTVDEADFQSLDARIEERRFCSNFYLRDRRDDLRYLAAVGTDL